MSMTKTGLITCMIAGAFCLAPAANAGPRNRAMGKRAVTRLIARVSGAVERS
jgi:hypothetical protein